MATEVPKRKVVRVLSPLALLKRGERANVILECGHADKFLRRDLGRGKVPCFDCYYGKSVNTLSGGEV